MKTIIELKAEKQGKVNDLMNTYGYYTEKKVIKYFAGIRCDDTENIWNTIKAKDINQARLKLRKVYYFELKLIKRGKAK